MADEPQALGRLVGRRAARSIDPEIQFADFSEAFGFMARVAAWRGRGEGQPPPDWSNSWNKGDHRPGESRQGRLTDRDKEMAEAINKLGRRPY